MGVGVGVVAEGGSSLVVGVGAEGDNKEGGVGSRVVVVEGEGVVVEGGAEGEEEQTTSGGNCRVSC